MLISRFSAFALDPTLNPANTMWLAFVKCAVVQTQWYFSSLKHVVVQTVCGYLWLKATVLSYKHIVILLFKSTIMQRLQLSSVEIDYNANVMWVAFIEISCHAHTMTLLHLNLCHVNSMWLPFIKTCCHATTTWYFFKIKLPPNSNNAAFDHQWCFVTI